MTQGTLLKESALMKHNCATRRSSKKRSALQTWDSASQAGLLAVADGGPATIGFGVSVVCSQFLSDYSQGCGVAGQGMMVRNAVPPAPTFDKYLLAEGG